MLAARTRTLFSFTLTACAFLVLATCSDDETTAGSFETSYPQAYCDYVFRCCDSSERSFGSKGQCESRIGDQVKALLAFAKEGQAKARFLASAAEQCLSKLQDKDCTVATASASCLYNVTQPLLSQGDDCLFNAECPSYYCNIPSGTTDGYCNGSSTLGGGCNGDDRACPSGSTCNTAKKCVSKGEAGDNCAPNLSGRDCKSGVCSPSNALCASAPEPRCDGK